VAKRLTGSDSIAVLAGSCFLLNPLQLEATLWVSGLQDVLWLFFFLVALDIYLSFPRVSVRSALVVAPLLAASLLSKETAVCFLLLIGVCDVALKRFERMRDVAGPYAVLGSLLLVYLAVRSRYAVPDPNFFIPPSRYFIKQLLVMPYKFFIQPWNSEVIVDASALPLAVSALFAGAVLFATMTKRLSRRWLVGPLFVLCTSLPVYSYFFVSPNLMAARYLYGPAVGWAMLLAGLIVTLPSMSTVRVEVPIALIVFSGWMLYANLQPWFAAAEVVRLVEVSLRAQSDPAVPLRDFQLTHPMGLRMRGRSVPLDYKGVYILQNGYEDLTGLVRAAAAREAR
jgi:hypothetical protein